MRIFDLQQGSKEWLDFRKDRYMASDAGAIMCVSPFKTPNQLWREKCLGEEPKIYKPACEWGKKNETPAKIWAENKLKLKFNPVVCVSDELEYIGASLDGYNAEHNIILEIKCPGEAQFKAMREGPSDAYYLQMQQQMYVTGARLAYFVVFDGFDGYIHEIQREGIVIEELIHQINKFKKLVDDFEEPALIDADCPTCEDQKFIEISEEWEKFDDIEKQAKYEKEVRKTALNEEALRLGYNRMRFGNCKLCISDNCKNSHYDMEAIAKDTGIDLEKYRKAPTKKITLTRSK